MKAAAARAKEGAINIGWPILLAVVFATNHASSLGKRW